MDRAVGLFAAHPASVRLVEVAQAAGAEAT